MEFQGFPKEMFEFFMAISFNNNIEFFEENRKSYEKNVKRPLYAFAEGLAPAALEVDAGMEVRPSKAVSRLRRDTRFTRDKLPYRDHMWIGFRRQGSPKGECFSLYFEIGCEALRYGAGWYDDDARRAKVLRAAILRRQRDFQSIAEDPALNREFVLKTSPYKRIELPDGLPRSLVPYYTAKGFYFEHEEATGAQALSPALLSQVSKGFLVLKSVYQFMLEETWKLGEEPEREKSKWEGFF
ncbi:MAG: DUF2461 domain-containing protein [Christensenellaceae bacterium]|jgi:uncharacterized protein (TIGR02453 family)|nr:DUF2461 domain-containing protein [Christensenellaceae bacterium]